MKYIHSEESLTIPEDGKQLPCVATELTGRGALERTTMPAMWKDSRS